MVFRYYGDPVLRRRAEEISEITDEVRRVVDELFQAMREFPAAGVAGPQVGHSLRVFVARLDDWDAHGRFVEGETFVFINPKLSNPSEETWVTDEGCLSIPGLRVPVERPVSITVEALDLQGRPFRLDLTGLPARIIMHENDHLNGKLTIDRTSPRVRKLIDQPLRALKKSYGHAA